MCEQQKILDFWFLPEDHPDHGQKRVEWFKKDSDFDTEIIQRFQTVFEKAVNGDYLFWTDSPPGCLALILLFDQFSRNMFRGDPKSFIADAKAREIARHMISTGYFDLLPSVKKSFVLMPFEHSEDLDDQEFCVKMFKDFGDETDIDYALQHYEIIKKFGRFPHRNDVLGRNSTEEETAFLEGPNSSF